MRNESKLASPVASELDSLDSQFTSSEYSRMVVPLLVAGSVINK